MRSVKIPVAGKLVSCREAVRSAFGFGTSCRVCREVRGSEGLGQRSHGRAGQGQRAQPSEAEPGVSREQGFVPALGAAEGSSHHLVTER